MNQFYDIYKCKTQKQHHWQKNRRRPTKITPRKKVLFDWYIELDKKNNIKSHRPDRFYEHGNIVSNISYNLQYLEYLEETIRQLDITGVIIAQTAKSYAIT